jgi:hypothetical protein
MSEKTNIESKPRKSKLKIAILVIIFVIIGIVISASYSMLNNQNELDKLKGLGYTNTNFRFGLNPPAGWSINETTTGAFGVYFVNHNTTASLAVYAPYSLSGGETLQSYAMNDVESFRTNINDFSLISSVSKTINGLNAYEIVYTGTIGTSFVKQSQTYIEKDGHMIIAVYTGNPPSSFDLNLLTVDQSINSIIFV